MLSGTADAFSAGIQSVSVLTSGQALLEGPQGQYSPISNCPSGSACFSLLLYFVIPLAVDDFLDRLADGAAGSGVARPDVLGVFSPACRRCRAASASEAALAPDAEVKAGAVADTSLWAGG